MVCLSPSQTPRGLCLPLAGVKAEAVVKSEDEDEAFGDHRPGSRERDVPQHPAAGKWVQGLG